MKRSDVVVIRNKADVVSAILPLIHNQSPKQEKGLGFAPTNIALCKYWGKRNETLNLPLTSSLSIALPDKGAMTTLTVIDQPHDKITLNGHEVEAHSEFVKRLVAYLDLFRPNKSWQLHVDINMNVPPAAGLASSASGFASLIAALNDLFGWQLALKDMSILARLGSGSAARSLWTGFVEWHAGIQADGMDSFAEPIDVEWPSLTVGVLTVSDAPKPISSREAMQRTVNSSALYSNWPKKVAQDMAMVKQALNVKNFALLGGAAESNALSMHATMLSSWPPICYHLPETIAAMHKVWGLRRDGLEVFFTQDAGPNLKLLFLDCDLTEVQKHFPTMEVVKVFE